MIRKFTLTGVIFVLLLVILIYSTSSSSYVLAEPKKPTKVDVCLMKYDQDNNPIALCCKTTSHADGTPVVVNDYKVYTNCKICDGSGRCDLAADTSKKAELQDSNRNRINTEALKELGFVAKGDTTESTGNTDIDNGITRVVPYIGDESTWCKKDPNSGKKVCTCHGGPESTDCLHCRIYGFCQDLSASTGSTGGVLRD